MACSTSRNSSCRTKMQAANSIAQRPAQVSKYSGLTNLQQGLRTLVFALQKPDYVRQLYSIPCHLNVQRKSNLNIQSILRIKKTNKNDDNLKRF